MIQKDYVIIGAGISGLSIANALIQKYPNIVDKLLLIDKGYYAGGRCSSRTVGSQKALVDFGISGQALKQELFEKNQLSIHDNTQNNSRLLVQNLTNNLNIMTKTRIKSIQNHEKYWELYIDNTGETIRCEHLILTAPIPQTIELLSHYFEHCPEDQSKLEDLLTVSYDRAISLMYTDDILPTLIETHKNDLLKTNIRQIYKNTDESAITLVLNASASLDYWDYSATELTSALFPDLPYFDDDAEMSLHRWRYAFANHRLEQPMILSQFGLKTIIFNDAVGGTSKVDELYAKAIELVNHLL